MNTDIRKILEDLEAGGISVDDALLALKTEPYRELGYAKVDLHRKIRQGASEVIYGEGKTADQIVGIVHAMLEVEQERILITRLDEAKAIMIKEAFADECADTAKATDKVAEKAIDFEYFAQCRIGIVGGMPQGDGIGKIVIATGGTSDIPVAEEAALTAEFLGNEVIRLYDVGVSGIHRMLSHTEEIMTATVIIAVAGMEGALPSVISGFADAPVIAVPTSVGYGASFGGVAALLAMINSCASGVSVVNIDNGFGAGYIANQINHITVK